MTRFFTSSHTSPDKLTNAMSRKRGHPASNDGDGSCAPGTPPKRARPFEALAQGKWEQENISMGAATGGREQQLGAGLGRDFRRGGGREVIGATSTCKNTANLHGNSTSNSNKTKSKPTPKPQSTSKPTLADKFRNLYIALRDVLNETATDDEWIVALGGRVDGSGNAASEESLMFMQALKQLNASGDLSWMRAMEGWLAAGNAKLVVEAVKKEDREVTMKNEDSTNTAATWPPPLPPITNPTILTQVFTHRSYLGTAQSPHTPENAPYDRLEFLGDSALQYISTLLLYQHLPHSIAEGTLSTIRQKFVSNRALHTYSITYGLPSRVLLGPDGRGQNIVTNTKIGADVLEAYLGGIIADNPSTGIFVVRDFLSALFLPAIQTEKCLLLSNSALATPSSSSFSSSSTFNTPGIAPLIDRNAKHTLWNTLGGHPGTKLRYDWTGGGGGNKGGYWYTAVFSGYGYEDLELGRGWGANKNEGMARAAMAALGNRGLVEEVRRVKEEFLQREGELKKRRAREKEEREFVKVKEEEEGGGGGGGGGGGYERPGRAGNSFSDVKVIYDELG